MNETILTSGWDTFLIAVPLIALLAISTFRLDEALVGRRHDASKRRPAGMDSNGDPILCDPDGRPSWAPRAAK